MEIDSPFYSVKRRKFIRPAALRQTTPATLSEAADEADSQPKTGLPSIEQPPETSPNDPEVQIPQIDDILRLRKKQRARRGGIGFSASNKITSDGGQRISALVSGEQDVEGSRPLDISDRFVKHTGQKVDVDRHIYIETEMARRHLHGESQEKTWLDADANTEDGTAKRLSDLKLPPRQPATLGKLHEIDLGPDSKLQNIARTQAATKKLAGHDDRTADDSSSHAKSQKLENSEKPYRGRRRRNSEDVRRDQLVEEVLRESKLDVYEEPEMMQTGDGQAADDRIAEQFRRDFLDAIQSRRRGARAKHSKSKKGDAPRGPKLGGSRSARAAMREKQKEAAQK